MTLLLISSDCKAGIKDKSPPCSLESESVCGEQSWLQFHCYICFVMGTRGCSTPHGGPLPRPPGGHRSMVQRCLGCSPSLSQGMPRGWQHGPAIRGAGIELFGIKNAAISQQAKVVLCCSLCCCICPDSSTSPATVGYSAMPACIRQARSW